MIVEKMPKWFVIKSYSAIWNNSIEEIYEHINIAAVDELYLAVLDSGGGGQWQQYVF